MWKRKLKVISELQQFMTETWIIKMYETSDHREKNTIIQTSPGAAGNN